MMVHKLMSALMIRSTIKKYAINGRGSDVFGKVSLTIVMKTAIYSRTVMA